MQRVFHSADLLSVPVAEDRYPPLNLAPQKQKEKTLEVLMAWLAEEAEHQPVLTIWEDLHWIDPSSLELLGMLLDETATAQMLLLLTCRPEFAAPWGNRSHLTPLPLSRLGHSEIADMVANVTGGRQLPAALLDQIVTKTDGVPLFVEELTKTIVESGVVQAVNGHYELTGPVSAVTIPVTLQDSLMARLDRLGDAKGLAQLGAVIGREFAYELVQALMLGEEPTLQARLSQLVQTELVYQRGRPPRATYTFKHALIQDTAYASLLRRTRQQYHQQIAQSLAERFVEIAETQPELLAHHYTEAGLVEQAVPYWQQAGQRAAQRSANAEAVAHLSTGVELLKSLPDTPERAQQELSLQLALGPVLMATKSIAHVDTESVYTRARELCQQLGETPELFLVMWGLRRFYVLRARFETARELEEQLFRLAQNAQDPGLLAEAEWAWGTTSFWLGELAIARERYAHSLSLYNPQLHSSHAFQYGSDPGVSASSYHALTLWHLGYPDQALQESRRSVTLAQEVGHPFSLAYALSASSWLYYLRREVRAAREQIEVAIRLATEQELPYWVTWGGTFRGWALALQGEGEEGIAQLRESLAALRDLGQETALTQYLAMLADAYGAGSQPEDGLQVLTEALELVDENGERAYEAELYRLEGELSLQGKETQTEAAEVSFQKALNVAREQEAKSWELRAAISLARLWQQQGKQSEARTLLTEIYDWFTEGFNTADLKDAKVLLEELT